MLYLFNIATRLQRLQLDPQESKKKNIVQFDSDTTVTWKQGQGHQTWYELVDLKHGDNHEGLK